MADYIGDINSQDGSNLSGFANINASEAGANTIGTAGQTTFEGSGANLTGLPGAWTNEGTASLGAPAGTLNIGSLTAYEILNIYVFCPGTSAGALLRINFNSDTGNNYGYISTENGAAGVVGANVGYLQLQNTSSTNFRWYQITIYNNATDDKFCSWRGGHINGDTTTATTIEGFGSWNSASQISSIDLTTNGAFDLNTGTKIIVTGNNP